MPYTTRIAVLLAALALGACAAPRCRNEVSRRVASPDGSRDAVLYHRDCGDAGGAGTGVAVIPHEADLPDVPTFVLGLSSDVDVAVSWASPAELRLAYPAAAGLLGRMDRTSDGIAVRFDPR